MNFLRRKKVVFASLILTISLLFGGCGLYQENIQDGITTNIALITEQESIKTENLSGLIVEFIDVGQGDAILIKEGDTACMIDTGLYHEYDAVKNALDENGVTTLEYLFLTHPDADHIGSADLIIENYKVNNVVMPDKDSDSKTYQYLISAIQKMNPNVIHPNAGDVFCLENATITCLAPSEIVSDSNADSLVLKMEYGNTKYLFLGDATGEEMDGITTDIQADVVKLAHHGSANEGANSYEMLTKVSPSYAVISCGENNSYGHPHKETMDNIEQMGIKTFRTDKQGDITSYSDGNDIKWNVNEY